jgi:hypothetical protein
MVNARLPRCDPHVNIELDRFGLTTLGEHFPNVGQLALLAVAD